mmetsp:Transcript_11433/g.18568  ORF Transcript_11433/g.18568 Transcript_11433/m.18568 type:complete len:285 (-) Transcript_11433:217-1071(-)
MCILWVRQVQLLLNETRHDLVSRFQHTKRPRPFILGEVLPILNALGVDKLSVFAVVAQLLCIVLRIGLERPRPAQGNVALSSIVLASTGVVSVEPFPITVSHAGLPVGTDLDGVGLGSDKITASDDLLAVHEHLVPSLTPRAADPVLVNETEGVGSRRDALRHGFCLVSANVFDALELRTAIAREFYRSLLAELVNLKLNPDIGTPATARSSIVVIIVVVVVVIRRTLDGEGVHSLAPVLGAVGWTREPLNTVDVEAVQSTTSVGATHAIAELVINCEAIVART